MDEGGLRWLSACPVDLCLTINTVHGLQDACPYFVLLLSGKTCPSCVREGGGARRVDLESVGAIACCNYRRTAVDHEKIPPDRLMTSAEPAFRRAGALVAQGNKVLTTMRVPRSARHGRPPTATTLIWKTISRLDAPTNVRAA